jgi:hypothetical protein
MCTFCQLPDWCKEENKCQLCCILTFAHVSVFGDCSLFASCLTGVKKRINVGFAEYLLSPMYPYPVTVHLLPVAWLVPRAGRQTKHTPSCSKKNRRLRRRKLITIFIFVHSQNLVLRTEIITTKITATLNETNVETERDLRKDDKKNENATHPETSRFVVGFWRLNFTKLQIILFRCKFVNLRLFRVP